MLEVPKKRGKEVQLSSPLQSGATFSSYSENQESLSHLPIQRLNTYGSIFEEKESASIVK